MLSHLTRTMLAGTADGPPLIRHARGHTMPSCNLATALLVAAAFCTTNSAHAADHLTPCTDNILPDNPEFRFETAGSACGTVRSFDENGNIDGLVKFVLTLCNPPRAEDTILRLLDELDIPKPSAQQNQ
jgi:hypothetical protein